VAAAAPPAAGAAADGNLFNGASRWVAAPYRGAGGGFFKTSSSAANAAREAGPFCWRAQIAHDNYGKGVKCSGNGCEHHFRRGELCLVIGMADVKGDLAARAWVRSKLRAWGLQAADD
jgi:hypothetical protein